MRLVDRSIPNAAIAVIQNDEALYIFKDSSHDTLFQIGLLAKSFTGFGQYIYKVFASDIGKQCRGKQKGCYKRRQP